MTLAFRRSVAGWMLAISGAAAFFATITESTDPALRGTLRPTIALLLWGVGATFLMIGAVLTANTLRGPKTRLSLTGSALVCIGAVWMFALYAGPVLVRVLLEGNGAPGAVIDQIDATLSPFTYVLLVPFLVLLAGGACLGVGLARAGITTYTAGALWAVALISFALAGDTYWARAVDTAAVALALLVIGVHVAKHRAAIEGGDLPNLYQATRLNPSMFR